MRVIVNIHSNRTFEIAGWRARAVELRGKYETDLEEALKAVDFGNGRCMFDQVIGDGCLREGLILFVNGIRMPDLIDLKTKIKDNVQIHLMDKSRI